MKTAISLPAATFDAATRRAAALGISRSQFFAVAAERYLDELERTSLTSQINDVLDHSSPDDSSAVAAAAGRALLAGADSW